MWRTVRDCDFFFGEVDRISGCETRSVICVPLIFLGRTVGVIEVVNPRVTQNYALALGVSSRSIGHLKKRFVENGLEAALARKPREKPPREVKFDGAFEARLIALACSEAPEGYRRWTVRLLADKAVELKFAESVSHMSVQRVLKK
ncbi:MAG: helix-turn-helix domain-containing protein [Marinobacter sp.]